MSGRFAAPAEKKATLPQGAWLFYLNYAFKTEFRKQ
jgi:hypothetical protein